MKYEEARYIEVVPRSWGAITRSRRYHREPVIDRWARMRVRHLSDDPMMLVLDWKVLHEDDPFGDMAYDRIGRYAPYRAKVRATVARDLPPEYHRYVQTIWSGDYRPLKVPTR